MGSVEQPDMARRYRGVVRDAQWALFDAEIAEKALEEGDLLAVRFYMASAARRYLDALASARHHFGWAA